MVYTDIVGKRFGMLVVEAYLRKELYTCKSQTRFVYCYRCRCDCGTVFESDRVSIITDHKKSCGCQRIRRGAKNGAWVGYGEISGYYWNSVKRHSALCSRSFSITIQEAWEQFLSQNRCCALTGVPLVMDQRRDLKKGRQKNTASLDRIDSNKGYERENIQWVHKDINHMKSSFSEDHFLELCRAVVRYHETHQNLHSPTSLTSL